MNIISIFSFYFLKFPLQIFTFFIVYTKLIIMKTYKIILIFTILVLVLTGCASANSENIEGITPPQIDSNIPPQTDSPHTDKPNTDLSETVEPLTPLTPATQIKEYDSLIQINATTKLYTKSGKYISTVYKNDYLPLISSDKNGYTSIFNYNTVYIPKSSGVSIKKIEKKNNKIEKMIDVAKSAIGTKYVYGAERYHFNGKKNSKFNKYYFDCSSLTQYAMFLSNNIVIGANSRSQAVEGKLVKKSQIERGDLLFFTNSSRQHNSGINRVGHVGIYLGNNLILHTSSDYAIIENISNKRWNNYISARRYI